MFQDEKCLRFFGLTVVISDYFLHPFPLLFYFLIHLEMGRFSKNVHVQFPIIIFFSASMDPLFSLYGNVFLLCKESNGDAGAAI